MLDKQSFVLEIPLEYEILVRYINEWFAATKILASISNQSNCDFLCGTDIIYLACVSNINQSVKCDLCDSLVLKFFITITMSKKLCLLFVR